ncbi:hypothetical protein FA95DRAFT_1613397 [Auriscalpium vulgare]|uniref:Uncharacterized protein n=1 Tax=Auriscalpium vulgare TaxID=40419 RepID=A0ACB8R2V0_9AGAM|nr:hypothetical protein FA95DRAFT_1613397 [Auriscalpium vulgare]
MIPQAASDTARLPIGIPTPLKPTTTFPNADDEQEQPPHKRRRAADNEDAPPKEYTRHQDLWLEDGTIVIVAESTLFRVHKSVLRRHSDFFFDMFAMPQPEFTEEMVDGCPVVQFHDTAADVAHILSALYTRVHEAPSVERFDYISAILRLGGKYQIRALEREALRRLQEAYPTRLEDFQRASHPPRTYFRARSEPFQVLKLVQTVRGDDAEAQKKLDRIAAVAMYECCQLDPEEVASVEKDGLQLDSQFHRQYAAGRWRLQEQKALIANKFLGWRVPGSFTTCCSGWDNEWAKHLQGAVEANYFLSVDALTCSANDPLFRSTVERLCFTCSTQLTSEYDSQVREVWIRLSEVLRVPSPT